MSVLAKLAGFAAVLVVVFGVAAAVGSAVGPDREDDAKERAKEPAAHGGEMAEHEAADPIRGLATSEEGLKLALEQTALERGEATELRFTVEGANGATSRSRTRSGCT